MSSATFIKQDTATQGSWPGVYGGDGSDIAVETPNLPSYTTATVAGESPYTWTSVAATDPRALVFGSTRVSTGWFSATNFTVNLNLTDGNTHQVALYFCDFNAAGRTQTVTIADAVTGAVWSTETLSSFSSGIWLVWNISENVIITVTNTGDSPNAVLSGLFFAPVPSSGGGTGGDGGTTNSTPQFTVIMVTTPAAPSHSAVLAWEPVSGASGYNVYRAPSATATPVLLNSSPLSSPAYVDLTVAAGQSYVYTSTAIVGGVESAPSAQVPITIPTP